MPTTKRGTGPFIRGIQGDAFFTLKTLNFLAVGCLMCYTAVVQTKQAMLISCLQSSNGKYVILSGTEHPHDVYVHLFHALRTFTQKDVWSKIRCPSKQALQNHNASFWKSHEADKINRSIIESLEHISPGGWQFRVPIFGINMEFGWFQIEKYPIQRGNQV